jgi:hypothetical protein
MTKVFEFPGGENIDSPQGEPMPRIEHGNEGERYWPLINTEESRFIENAGGKYIGFVEDERGRRRFEDLRIDRFAYYDDRERAVIELFVAIEGVNEEGSNELRGPNDISGFTVLAVRRSQSGQELGKPEIISLRSQDFSDRKRELADLRILAAEVRGLLLAGASEAEPSELRRRVEAHLQSQGWRN